MLGAGVFVLFYMLMRGKRRKRDPLDHHAGPGLSLSQQRRTEEQMQHLLVELAEMSRQISAQLDTRSKKLELLIHDADERIAVLRTMTETRASSTSSRPAHPAHDVNDEGPPAAPLDPRHAQVYDLADKGRTATQIAEELARPRGEVELILALRPRA